LTVVYSDGKIVAMTADFTKPPYSFFAPPGVVRVSASALKLAQEFAEDAKRVRPSDEFVISFDWADSRSVRQRIDGPREELGPGLDLAAYDRPAIPPEVIQKIDELAFAVKIPRHIYEKSVHRLIDIDDRQISKLTLR
jgi:hypothetical protein